MRESEAKTKICPFIDVLVVEYNDMHNRSTDTTRHKCICGDCMAWKDVSLGDEHLKEGYCLRIPNSL